LWWLEDVETSSPIGESAELLLPGQVASDTSRRTGSHGDSLGAIFMHAIRFLAAIHEACEAPTGSLRRKTPLREIRGGDSVSITSLSTLLREQFRWTMSPPGILQSHTVADLLEAVTRGPAAAKISA
jgi:hypothetical protein